MNTPGIHIGKNKLRIGIIASSNGGVFRELVRILDAWKPNFFHYCVVTDRACGIELFCAERNIPYHRFEEPSNENFSVRARDFLMERGGVDFVQLYFTRLVTEALFKTYPTLNLHPSLLPDFPGFNALKKAMSSPAKYFGATLHLVSEQMDAGPVLAQYRTPFPKERIPSQINKRSFLQKTYLSLWLVEQFILEHIAFTEDFSDVFLFNSGNNTSKNPVLAHNVLQEAFLRLQEREGESLTP